MDDELRGILEAETNEIVTSNISLFDDWWEVNIEVVNEILVLKEASSSILDKVYHYDILGYVVAGLTLFIAVSKPEEIETVRKLLVSVLNNGSGRKKGTATLPSRRLSVAIGLPTSHLS
jgi:hypothetical protein